jgi:hypothetical protein
VQSLVNLARSILYSLISETGSCSHLCDAEKLLSQPRKAFTSLLQPTSGRRQVSICPSLILHGRTEIKARALVLGEVSALSFCLLAILPIQTKIQPPRRTKGTKNLLQIVLCLLCLFVAKLFPPLCGTIRRIESRERWPTDVHSQT